MNYINGLHFNNIRGDIYGGLTAAAVALAMAMGVAPGVGPIVGTCKSVGKMLKNQGVLKLLDAENIFQKRTDALVHAQELLSD